MYGVRERPGRRLDQEPEHQRGEQEPETQADERGGGEGSHRSESERSLGQRKEPGTLFAIEMVALQLVWLGVIAFALWLFFV